MDPITYTIALGAAGAGGAAESYWITIAYDDGESYDIESLTADSDGNVYATGRLNQSTGTTMPNKVGQYHAKYDQNGSYQLSRVWKATYNTVNARLQFNAVDSNGNIYIAGNQPYQIVSGNIVASGGFVAKYNAAGADQWDKILPATSHSTTDTAFQFSCVRVDSSDNIICTGRSRGGGISPSGYYIQLAKFNTSGALTAEKAIYGSYVIQTEGHSCAIDASDNIFVNGYSNNASVTIKLNSSLAVQWARSYEMGGTEPMALNMDADSSGNVYIRHYDYSDNIITKYNSSGTLQWQKQIAFDAVFGGGLACDTSGNVYVSGTKTVSSVETLTIVKFNTSGTEQWKRQIKSSGGAVTGGGIFVAGDNLYVCAKIADSSGHTYGLVAKLLADGTLTGAHSTTDFGTITYESSSISITTPTKTDSSYSANIANTSWTAGDSAMTEYSFTFADEENITLS